MGAIMQNSRQFDATGYPGEHDIITNASVADSSQTVNRDLSSQDGVFRGYPLPHYNTTTTPNQFVDVVIRNASLCCIRVVGAAIVQHYRYGNELLVIRSESQFAKQAGVSERSLPSALREALESGYLTCVQEPRPKTKGCAAQHGIYRLKFDRSGKYVTSPKNFKGFYKGQGCFTPLPDLFFDYTIKKEKLGVIKVAAAILRNTTGYSRDEVDLSRQELSFLTGLAEGRSLESAVKDAVKNSHILMSQPGSFGHKNSKTKFCVQWLDRCKNDSRIGAKMTAGDPGKNDSRNAANMTPENRGKNDSNMEMTSENACVKQQQAESDVVALLVSVGLSYKAARELAGRCSLERARELVKASESDGIRNRAAWVRRAIEANYQLVSPTPPDPKMEAFKKKQREESDLEAHKEKYYPQYCAFVQSVEDTARLLSPTLLEAFEQYERDNPPKINSELFIELHKRQRPERFAQFAREHGYPLPDFWEWDAEKNPGGYRK